MKLAAIGLVALTAVMCSQTGTTAPPGTSSEVTVFFHEGFDDTDLRGRGWYDNTNLTITTAEHALETSGSLEVRFEEGASTPTWGAGARHGFAPNGTVYVSYWVKYQAGWQGSGARSHPHEFYIVTTDDPDFVGPASATLTAYIEHNTQNGQVPRIGVQNEDHPSVSGGGLIWDGPPWTNDAEWHFIEALFELNTPGKADGALRMWVDLALVVEGTGVTMRGNSHPTMLFDQLIVGPFMSRSPITQTMWIDEITVADGRVSGSPPS